MGNYKINKTDYVKVIKEIEGDCIKVPSGTPGYVSMIERIRDNFVYHVDFKDFGNFLLDGEDAEDALEVITTEEYKELRRNFPDGTDVYTVSDVITSWGGVSAPACSSGRVLYSHDTEKWGKTYTVDFGKLGSITIAAILLERL